MWCVSFLRWVFSTDSLLSLQLPIVSVHADMVFSSRLCQGSPYESTKQVSLAHDGWDKATWGRRNVCVSVCVKIPEMLWARKSRYRFSLQPWLQHSRNTSWDVRIDIIFRGILNHCEIPYPIYSESITSCLNAFSNEPGFNLCQDVTRCEFSAVALLKPPTTVLHLLVYSSDWCVRQVFAVAFCPHVCLDMICNRSTRSVFKNDSIRGQWMGVTSTGLDWVIENWREKLSFSVMHLLIALLFPASVSKTNGTNPHFYVVILTS